MQLEWDRVNAMSPWAQKDAEECEKNVQIVRVGWIFFKFVERNSEVDPGDSFRKLLCVEWYSRGLYQ